MLVTCSGDRMLEAQEESDAGAGGSVPAPTRVFRREQLQAIQRISATRSVARMAIFARRNNKLELPNVARAEVELELGRSSVPGGIRWRRRSSHLSGGIAELPWTSGVDDQLDLPHAMQVLDEDHYGLKDVKDRVLEFLAVRQLRAQQLADEVRKTGEYPAAKLKQENDEATPTLSPDGDDSDRKITDEKEAKARAMAKGPILLFIGPPGVRRRSPSIAALARPILSCVLGRAREGDIRGTVARIRRMPAPHSGMNRRGRRIPSSCWMRWISWACRSRVIRRARCSRCSTRRRTTPSPIII